MGGIIGRLFREFAVTLSMAILVSAFVALTLTPMMASRVLRPPKEAHHGKLYALSERAFDALLHAYERGLDIVCGTSASRCACFSPRWLSPSFCS